MKRWMAMLLSVCMLGCCFSANVFADEAAPGGAIEARFSDFGNVFATMTYDSSTGICHVEGGATTYSSKKWVEITLTIEQYTTAKRISAGRRTFVECVGLLRIITQADRDLSRGTYRAHTVAKCYQNGVLLETVESYSVNVTVPRH